MEAYFQMLLAISLTAGVVMLIALAAVLVAMAYDDIFRKGS